MSNMFAMRRPFQALLVVAMLGAAACSPILHTHGYTPRTDELERIQVGVDNRTTVQNKLGRPSTLGAFDDEEWLYISIKSETVAFFEPEVVEQQVVMVVFNEAGVVSDVGRYGMEEGRVVDLVRRTTPTSGRELTVLQQVFGNLGRYNSGSNILEQIGGGVPSGGGAGGL